jgi:hypothetical protein
MGAQNTEDVGGPRRDAGAGALPGRRLPGLGLVAVFQLVHAAGPVSGGHHVEAAAGAVGRSPASCSEPGRTGGLGMGTLPALVGSQVSRAPLVASQVGSERRSGRDGAPPLHLL